MPSSRALADQKQSLAFMLHNERSTDAELEGQRHELVQRAKQHNRKIMRGHDSQWKNAPFGPAWACRGGWLCDEVGMGKTAGTMATDPTLGSRRFGGCPSPLPSCLC